jgi:hypothetical protein
MSGPVHFPRRASLWHVDSGIFRPYCRPDEPAVACLATRDVMRVNCKHCLQRLHPDELVHFHKHCAPGVHLAPRLGLECRKGARGSRSTLITSRLPLVTCPKCREIQARQVDKARAKAGLAKP